MAADCFYLVFALPNHPGRPIYLHRTSEVSDGTRGATPVLRPVFDDDIQQSQVWTNAEFAVQARDAWRSKGYVVALKDQEGNGPLLEREETEAPRYDDSRSRRFVLFTNGLGLYAVPCNTPEGPRRSVRAIDIPSFAQDGRHTAVESVFGNTPEEVAQKVLDVYGQQILFADPEAAARAEEEKRKAAAQSKHVPGLRPGDRR